MTYITVIITIYGEITRLYAEWERNGNGENVSRAKIRARIYIGALSWAKPEERFSFPIFAAYIRFVGCILPASFDYRRFFAIRRNCIHEIKYKRGTNARDSFFPLYGQKTKKKYERKRCHVIVLTMYTTVWCRFSYTKGACTKLLMYE